MSEEELESLPSITLEQEDIAGRSSHKSRGKGRGSSQPVEGEFASSAIAKSSDPRLIKGMIGLCFALLAAIVGLAWLHFQLQNSEKEAGLLAERVNQLENRLTSTDTTITQSEVLLANKLKSMDKFIDTNKSEIKKLWGVSYDINRKAIQNNKQLAETHTQQLKILETQNDAQQNQLAEQADFVSKVMVQAASAESSSREAVQRMELSQENVDSMKTQLVDLQQKHNNLDVNAKQRLTVLEDTAKSTDVFRRNTQDDIRRLREELLKDKSASANSSL